MPGMERISDKFGRIFGDLDELKQRVAKIAALKKQVEEMKAGVPLAALEAQIAALENKLNNGVTVTNIVKTIGSNKGGDQ